ncbi:MAG: hypothetical protein JWP75_3849, partial [Frondihabitans sp.]|nr:hypothetical protein [Frondihabitans sp.]
FAAFLVGGVLMRPTDEVLGWVLMAAAALPLLHLVVTLRRP